ncbi:uncharacterized protein H6S33_002869 [Morchella sextelata]|uniref:uncharacterized protein n=1 Tax=Morchella sextelata TaxID=1174677 RepID=UPI001D0531D5|nr:uncharacterized protein H6S33_002869 [Morchella sextelata]KAH0607835.1 hypothetical protein H6S33_002869 [Morchella sextelata]
MHLRQQPPPPSSPPQCTPLTSTSWNLTTSTLVENNLSLRPAKPKNEDVLQELRLDKYCNGATASIHPSISVLGSRLSRCSQT